MDEFAQFARLPRPALAPCDPREIVRQAVALYAARIASLGVVCEVDDAEAPARILADAEQLGRALKNVVQNALDAVERVETRRIRVTVRTSGSSSAPSRCEMEVRDSGPGFDAASLARVFAPYFTTRGSSGGTGLGMAIAQRIVSEHDGTIRAANAPGGGAIVTIAIAMAPPS